MTSTLQLGPLALPLSPLLLALAAWAGLAVGRRLGRRAGVDPEPILLRMLLLGLVVARLGFVWQWRGVYLHDPLTVLDLRDGGWEPVVGMVAASLYGLGRVSHRALLRRPVGGAFVTTLALWISGQAALLVWPTGSGRTLPELSLPALDGQTVQLAAFAGRPTVINLWATWCPPCRREMPLLQQAQAQHQDVNFVFVDQGETSEQVARYLSSQGLTLRHVLIDARKATGALFDEQALPTTLFFGADGRLVSTRVGTLSEATLAQRLAVLRATRGPETTGPAASR